MSIQPSLYRTSISPPAASGGVKRVREEEENSHTSRKKMRLEINLEDLPPELSLQYLRFLSFRDMLNLERVAKIFHAPDGVSLRWKSLAVEERLDFNWAICKHEAYPNKCRFLMGKILHAYIDARGSSPQNAYHRFEAVMLRFPSLGAFIWTDITRQSAQLGTTIETKYRETFEQNVQKSFMEEKEAGDLLLGGLLQLPAARTPEELCQVFSTFKSSIQKGATCTSLLAIKFFLAMPLVDFFYHLVVLSVGQSNDYRGIEAFLTKYSQQPGFTVEELIARGFGYPPVLAKKGYIEQKPLQKEKWYDFALREYQQEDVPAHIWGEAAQVKRVLKKYQEAEQLYDKALVAYGDQAPASVLAYAAKIKGTLKKYQEAEQLFDKALVAHGDQALVWDLASAAKVKLELKKYQEAEQLFDKALVAYGDRALAWVLADAAHTKLYLKKYQEAEQLFEKALVAYGDQAPAVVLASAAKVKLELKKYQEAEQLFEKALVAYGDQAPAMVLAIAAQAKLELGKYQEAEQLFHKALVAFGDQAPAMVLADVARLKEVWKGA